MGIEKKDNQIIMSQTKPSYHKHTLQKANRFKNLVILFGVCLGLFMILSFNSWISVTQASVAQEIQKPDENKPEEHLQNIDEISVAQRNLKIKTHHNFIASYLLQESSFERKNKNSEEHRNLISQLKQLHKIIISQAFRLF